MSCSDDDLELGDNLAVIETEIIQFGDAEPIGAGRFRLARLRRGRMGTEGAIANHREGARFVLVDRSALQPIILPVRVPGLPIRASALDGSAECSLILDREDLGRRC